MKKMIFFLISLGLIGCNKESLSSGQVQAQKLMPADSIIGGEVVASSSPYAKSIVGLYNLQDSSICTGSILSQTIIVTAAHCVPERASDLVVFFGGDIETATITRRVATIRVTKTWGTRMEEEADWGDVAILKLQSEIPSQFRPIKLLPNKFALKKGMSVVLAGYGLSNGVTRQGSGLLRATKVEIESPVHGKTEVVLNQKQGRGACHGDSGGPAYVRVGKELYIFGVTSRGYQDRRDDCSQFSIYTNLQAYSDTIGKLL